MKSLPEERSWHAETVEDILGLFETQLTGLTNSEAERRLESFGLNALPAKKTLHPVLKFLLQFNNIIIYLLIAVMIFCFATQEWIEAVIVFVVVIINAIIGFVQEFKADKDSEVLAKMLSMSTIVMRNGQKETVESNKIVVGDVIILQGGDKIPADARLFEVKNFQTQEAALTGEVTSNPKTVNILAKEAVLGERSNFVFSGTYASQGTSQGIVVATGVFTELGKINHMVQNVDEKKTPLTHHMEIFGRFLVVICIIMIVIAFLGVYFKNRDKITVIEAILYAVSIGVALIPEGLPAITSLTLAIGMQRMAKRRALVRQLPAVETLGAVSVICSDKTGTLTTNQMTVRGFVVGKSRFAVSGTGYDPCDGVVENINANGPITLEVQLNQMDPRNETTISYMPGTDEYAAMQDRVRRYAERLRTHAALIRRKLNDSAPDPSLPIPPSAHVAPSSKPVSKAPALTASLFNNPDDEKNNNNNHAASHSGHSGSSSSTSTSTSSDPSTIAPLTPKTPTTPMTPTTPPAVPAKGKKGNTQASATDSSEGEGPSTAVAAALEAAAEAAAGRLVHLDDQDLEFTNQNQILAMCRCGIVCNDSSLVFDEEAGSWKVIGDPTEGALLPLANKCAINVMKVLAECPRLDIIPFESDYGYMATVNKCPFDVNTNVHYRQGAGEDDEDHHDAYVSPHGLSGNGGNGGNGANPAEDKDGDSYGSGTSGPANATSTMGSRSSPYGHQNGHSNSNNSIHSIHSSHSHSSSSNHDHDHDHDHDHTTTSNPVQHASTGSIGSHSGSHSGSLSQSSSSRRIGLGGSGGSKVSVISSIVAGPVGGVYAYGSTGDGDENEEVEVEMGGNVRAPNEHVVSPSTWSFFAEDVESDAGRDGNGGNNNGNSNGDRERERQEIEQQAIDSSGSGSSSSSSSGMEKEKVKEKPRPDDGEKKKTSHDTSEVFGTDTFIFLKGAPERIFDLCDYQTYTDENQLCRIKPIDVDYWRKETEDIAAVGLRTIALAERRLPHTRFAGGATTADAEKTDELTQEEIRAGGFTLLGVVGIVDPARTESQRAIRKCRRARIKVVMITGDHAKTAAAIGKFLTLGGEVRTSTQLGEMSDEELLECVDHVDIFARATPADKLRIVRAFQTKGYVTAMTGDGVNDAPALKQAHAGIAMGISGTEVAKEASKMVLLDDNFATIVAAVEEGRKIYNSIKRSIIFTLPTNAGEGLILFISSFISHIPPIQAVQILYINTLTSVLLSSMIPFQRGDKRVLAQPPRDPKKTFLTSTMLIRTGYKGVLIAGLVIGWFYWHVLENGEVVEDRIRRYSTVSCTTVLLCEICALFNTVHLKENSFTPFIFRDAGPVSLIAILILIGLQCFIVYTPFVNEIFHLTPIGILDWLTALLCGLIVFCVVEIEKLIRRIGHRAIANYRRKKRRAEGGELGEEEEELPDDGDSEDEDENGNGAIGSLAKTNKK